MAAALNIQIGDRKKDYNRKR